MAAEEVNVAIRFVLATLLNIEQLKLEEEECLRHFIADRFCEPTPRKVNLMVNLASW